MGGPKTELLRGTLDLLILKVVAALLQYEIISFGELRIEDPGWRRKIGGGSD